MCDPLPLEDQPINSSKKVGLRISNNLTPTFLARLHLDSFQRTATNAASSSRGALQLPSFVVGTVRVVRNWWNREMASIKSLF